MQLREPEAVGLLDDHDRRVRDVDADLDHGRRDEHVELPRLELRHQLAALGGPQPPVHAARRGSRFSSPLRSRSASSLGGSGDARLRLLDQRADDVRLAAGVEVLAQARYASLERSSVDPRGHDRLAVRRRLRDLAHLEVAVDRERERARDRRRGHVQDMRRAALGERAALLDAEAVLLVDDRDREVGEVDPLLDQRVRADERSAPRRCGRAARFEPTELVSSTTRDAELARRAPRRSGSAARRASRSAPSARPGGPPRPRAGARTARRRSCPSRRRPGAAAASASSARGRRSISLDRALLVLGERERAAARGSARSARRARRAPAPRSRSRPRAGARARAGATSSSSNASRRRAALGLLGVARAGGAPRARRRAAAARGDFSRPGADPESRARAAAPADQLAQLLDASAPRSRGRRREVGRRGRAVEVVRADVELVPPAAGRAAGRGVPGFSLSASQAWLNQTAVISPLSSATRAVTIARRRRGPAHATSDDLARDRDLLLAESRSAIRTSSAAAS